MSTGNKKRVAIDSLPIGALCYPRSARPSGSFLRTQWRVGRFDQDSRRVLVKLGRQVRFLNEGETVLIDAPPTSDF